jgi:tetratricopeptide (TPR) repeat protein
MDYRDNYSSNRIGRMRTGLLLAAGLVIGLAGCDNGMTVTPEQVSRYYQRGDYRQAKARALLLRDNSVGRTHDEAQFMAGMSAYRLGQDDQAMRLLEPISTHADTRIAGPASATVGLILAEANDDERALTYLRRARAYLSGEDQARVYYHQALVEQKMGFWSSAKAHLRLAERQSADPQLRRQIRQRRNAQAFALQLGAYSNQKLAEKRAADMRKQLQTMRLVGPKIVPTHTSAAQRLYLVQAGRFDTHAQARAAMHRLDDADVWVVAVE